MSARRVVALLGAGIVPARSPILRADDAGVLRGDGVFETMHGRDGKAWLLAEHLDRLAASARRMGLTLPERDSLAALVGTALAAWPAAVEAAVRLVCTHGGAAYVTVEEAGDVRRNARHTGIAVVTYDAPRSLGAKSLSYAVNLATLRRARAEGADDVLWISDGHLLEAPTSSLVWLEDSTLYTVPVESTGILPGTTAQWLLDHAGVLGWTAKHDLVTPVRLHEADGVWLTSSVRGVAAIRSLDGTPMPYSPTTTAQIRALLGFP